MNPVQLHLPPHLQHLKGEELHAALKQEYRVQAVAFILRQTDYTEDVANEKLDALKDPMKVIQEYLGESKIPSSSSQPVCTSKNKMKYGEIRKFMDAGARQYNRQKEINEQRRKYQERIEQQQQQQQQQKYLEQQQPHLEEHLEEHSEEHSEEHLEEHSEEHLEEHLEQEPKE